MSDCKIWDGPTCANGRYGRILGSKPMQMAHRASYEANVGPIPEGMLVLHRCDVPLCVNPEHLFLGTHQDNMDDMAAKGRRAMSDQRGQSNNNAHPDLEARYQAIKADRDDGMTYRELREKHGIKSNGHLRNIITSGC